MVKGCQRKIIQIKDTGSALFTEAYFVLSEEAEGKKEMDIVEEATRLINVDREEKRGRACGRWQVLVGFLSGFLACGGGIAFCLWLF